MNLLIVTRENAEDRRYGLGQSVGRIASGLRSRGHQVKYMARHDCEDFHRKWHSRISRWLSPLGSLAAPLSERIIQGAAAADHALTHKDSHVWIHDPWMAIGLRLGLIRRGVFRRPFRLAISEHGLGSFAWATAQDGLSPSPALYRYLIRLERRILSKCNTVFCPSEAVLAALKRDLALHQAPSGWTVLGYGHPEMELPQKLNARLQLGVAPNTFVIGALGRIAPVKRFDLLVEAAVNLQNRGIHVQLVIAGGGDIETFYRSNHCDRLQMPPILGTQDNPATVLAASDVYVSTCAVESFGMANREALAAGIPAVIAAGGASNEVLGNGAWLMPANPQLMADALQQLHDDPAIRQFWCRQARHSASAWPSWDEVVERYEQELLRVH